MRFAAISSASLTICASGTPVISAAQAALSDGELEDLLRLALYQAIDSGTTQWSDGWYVASGQVTIDRSGEPDPDDRCVSVTGDVYLSLADACVLTIKAAINLEQGASLTIYG